MSETFFVPGMRRALIYVLGAALVVMALVSLRQRVMQPDLVTAANPRSMQAGRDAGAEGGADEISALMQKIQQNPGDVDTLVHLSEHFLSDGNLNAAENFLRRAVIAAPGDARPPYLLGVVLHRQGKNEEAAAFLEQSLRLRDEPSVRYSLGVLYIHYLNDATRGSAHLRIALAQSDLPEALAALIREELAKLPPDGGAGATAPKGDKSAPKR